MIANVRRGALCALSALAFVVPASARAESVAPAMPADTSAAVATDLGPTVAAASVAVRSRTDASADAAAAQSRAGLGQPRALMFVGLAALIAGALIGNTPGTIIMIGGAAVGLYGLYHYLQ